MPRIIPSSDLRNSYNEVSNFCHQYTEPVYVTKNGQGDLAVMSIETYERLVGIAELSGLLADGLKASKEKRIVPAETAFDDVLREIGK